MAREAAVVRVWDLPTRLFHWALAFGVVAAIVSARLGGAAMTWHMRFGDAIFTLLAFRLTWGFAGGRWSRFDSFVAGPTTTLRDLRQRSLPHENHDVGQTRLGPWSVLALVVACAVGVALIARLGD
jgi:cytochrome b